MTNKSACLAALLSVMALLYACEPNPASWKQPNMTPLSPRLQPLFEKTKTVCFGRFVIDVPSTVEVIWGRVMVPWDVTIYPNGMATVDQIASENVARLKAELNIHHNKPSFVSEEKIENPPGKIVTGFQDFQSIAQHSVDAYFSMPPYGVHVESGDFADEPLGTAAELREMAQRLRVRSESEIATEPGQCIERAFLPDKPGPAKTRRDPEHIRIGFRLKEFPDAHLSIYVAPANRHNPESDSLDGQLKRTEELARNAGEGDPYAALKFFRRDKRQIHDWLSGFEILTRTPEEERSRAHHDFWMKFTGVGNDVLRPYADIQFKTGVEKNGAGAVPPSLTDEEAIALWDKLTSSIRVRPTSAAAKTSEAAPARDAPLGELAATGRTCPQTGWWECVEGSRPVQGDARRLLKAGERMPHAVLLGEPSLWQKLKGEQPIYKAATVWQLVGYDEPQNRAVAQAGLPDAPAATAPGAAATPEVGPAS